MRGLCKLQQQDLAESTRLGTTSPGFLVSYQIAEGPGDRSSAFSLVYKSVGAEEELIIFKVVSQTSDLEPPFRLDSNH